jgi:integrase
LTAGRHRTRIARRVDWRRSRTTNCDQRHSYAVRAARAGTPAELIARQLGHAYAVLVLKVYGRFMPSQQDRDK